jgi:sodium/potassium-transporting ATPase subunit alpha
MSGERQIQQLDPQEVYRYLDSRADGLNAGEVEERLLEVGPNSVEVRDRLKTLRSLAKQFTNFFTILLLISAAICFVADHLQPGSHPCRCPAGGVQRAGGQQRAPHRRG